MTELTAKLEANLQAVRARHVAACERVGRDPDEIRMVAVTKRVGLDAILALIRLGVSDLGENRVQQLQERSARIHEILEGSSQSGSQAQTVGPRWHMVGSLQRNKVKSLLPSVAMIHSVDRLRLAEEINRRAAERSARVDVLLEVNASDEPQKGGAAVCAAAHLGEQIMSMNHIRVRGLMAMAPLTDDEGTIRRAFTRVGELFEEIRHDGEVGDRFDILSMGMSNDFEIAIECGANLTRIGSALFEGITDSERGAG